MTLITDFSIAQPSARLITDDRTTFGPISRPKPGAWRLIDYETELFSGRFLQASDRQAAVLTVPLDCDGWHAVSIGIAGTGVKRGPASIEVRLDGDEHWQYLRAEGWIDYVEEPWIIADLTGRSLQVRFPQQGRGPVLARLCSVRAVPVRDEHVRELAAEQPRPPMFIHDSAVAEPGAEAIERLFRPYAGSAWTSGCYGVCGADCVDYPTEVGNINGQDAWDAEEGYLGSYDVVTRMMAQGLDPLQVAIDSAHGAGLALIVYLRVQLWTCEPPLDHQFRSRFYAAHPEYCCVEADGVADHSKLSVAFPEVRGQLNGIMRESLERGADGVSLCFARGFPLVRYEQPVLDRYRERYGGDARELDDRDERLRAVWAEITTEWIREIRELLDGFGPSERYERRKLALIAGPDMEWCLGYGIDVGAWGRAGLVDVVAPYPRGIERREDIGELLVDGVGQYAKAMEGTDVELVPSLGSFADHAMTVRELRTRADGCYRQGATGLSRWDTDHWMIHLGLESAAAQRLWVDHYMPPAANIVVSTAGLNRIRFNPRIGV